MLSGKWSLTKYCRIKVYNLVTIEYLHLLLVVEVHQQYNTVFKLSHSHLVYTSTWYEITLLPIRDANTFHSTPCNIFLSDDVFLFSLQFVLSDNLDTFVIE